MDRGMAGKNQRQVLQRGGGHVILGERLRSTEKVVAKALSRPGRFQKVRDNLEVKEVVVEEGSLKRRFVVVRNPQQAELPEARCLRCHHTPRSKVGHSPSSRFLRVGKVRVEALLRPMPLY